MIKTSLLAIALLSVPFFQGMAQTSRIKGFSYSQNDATFRALEETLKKYNMELHVGAFKPSGFFKGIAVWRPLSNSHDKVIKKYAEKIVLEWNKYPVDFVQKVGIKSIVLVTDLKYSGIRVGGLADILGKNLVMNVDYIDYPDVVNYLIHHEFFHYVDVRYLGLTFSKDPAWKKLNPVKFEYLGAGAAMVKSGKDITEFHPQDGFVTVYATSAVEEDKAEVFAYLMVTNYYLKRTITILDTDAIFLTKCNHIKRFLQQISADFTDEYFERIHRNQLEIHSPGR